MTRLLHITDHPPIEEIHGMIATSPQMRDTLRLIHRIARTEVTLLIRGESGTGKELVARALHDLGNRADKPFRAVNCATLTGDLLASELFGHVRGSFTGAVRDRQGLFAQADGGTLFLDEVAEIPLDIQPRLLRVLQERTYVPVGGTEPQTANVRVLTATHRALRREVARGNFRADLMYRIRVATLFLPPLREREGDIEALTWHFIHRFNRQGIRPIHSIEVDFMTALLQYPWPGNVRELRNAIEGAFAMGEGPTLGVEDLPPELRGEPPPAEVGIGTDSSSSSERQRIVDALRQTGGRKAQAAKLLGISRSTLWRKMRELGL